MKSMKTIEKYGKFYKNGVMVKNIYFFFIFFLLSGLCRRAHYSEAVNISRNQTRTAHVHLLYSHRRAAAVGPRCALTPPDPQLKGAWYPGGFTTHARIK